MRKVWQGGKKWKKKEGMEIGEECKMHTQCIYGLHTTANNIT